MIERVKGLLLDRSLWSFLLIGLGNTVLSLAIQLALYTYLDFGYWASSATAFTIASVSSFFLNRRFSFHSQGSLWGDALRFSVNIAVCYFVAYSLAQPAVLWAVDRLRWGWLTAWSGQIALVVGNGFFTCLNYFGQRFFAFKQK